MPERESENEELFYNSTRAKVLRFYKWLNCGPQYLPVFFVPDEIRQRLIVLTELGFLLRFSKNLC